MKISAAMDQAEGASCGASSLVSCKLESVTSQGNENMPKVRKPYTITKQRERWTDEEHKRFLEALKLYGRSWRQIEEHIGTKTAIQIRSHAQKFFAKVARDSGNDAMNIPPPRPKKKPLHPYPRKPVDSPVTIGDSAQSERSLSPDASLEGRGDRSPDSVLSPIGPDVFASPLAGCQSSRLSLASCTMGAHTVNKDGCMIPNSTIEEKVPVDDSCPITNYTMGRNLVNKGMSCIGEKLAVEAPLASIKLFRQTVFSPDAPKLESQVPVNCITFSSNATEEKTKISYNYLLHGFTSDQANSQFILAMVPGNMIPPACWLSQKRLDNNPNSAASHPATMSWWSWYQDLMYRYISPCSQTAAESTALFQVQNDEASQWEGSSTGCSIGSGSEVEDGNKDSDAAESKRTPKSEKQDCMKGFVPYKRCAADRDEKSAGIAEEREVRRARVCS